MYDLILGTLICFLEQLSNFIEAKDHFMYDTHMIYTYDTQGFIVVLIDQPNQNSDR